MLVNEKLTLEHGKSYWITPLNERQFNVGVYCTDYWLVLGKTGTVGHEQIGRVFQEFIVPDSLPIPDSIEWVLFVQDDKGE